MKSKKRLILPILTFLSFGMAVGTGVLNIVSNNDEPEMESVEAAVPTRFYLAKNSPFSKSVRLWDDTAKKETKVTGSVVVRGRTLDYYDYTPGGSNTLCFSVSGTIYDNERTTDYHSNDSLISNGYNAYSIITNWSGWTQYRQNGYWTKLSGTTTTECETSLTTAPRIYVDYSAVSNSAYVSDVMFYNDNRLNDDVNNTKFPSNSCVDLVDKWDYRSGSYNASSNGHFDSSGNNRKITPITVPWDAFKVKITMSNSTNSGIQTIPLKASTSTCLRAYLDANENVQWEWVIPEHKIANYIYLNYTASDSTWRGSIGDVTAQFSSGYYSNATFTDATEKTTVTVGTTQYVQIKVPDYATIVKFKRGAAVSDEITLAATDNVHYVVNNDSGYKAEYVYTLPTLGSNSSAPYTTPQYNTARLFLNCDIKTSAGAWANASNIFGISTWEGDHPTYYSVDSFKVYRMNYVDNDDATVTTKRYYYVDIPQTVEHFKFIIMNANGTPIYDEDDVEDVTTGTVGNPNSSYSYCYFISGTASNTATHTKGDVTGEVASYKVGNKVLTKLLEARDTCSSNVHNGYGDGERVYNNFFITPTSYSFGTVTTLDATQAYGINYVMDCLNGRQDGGRSYGKASDFELAFIALNNSNALIILIISSVSACILLSVGLITLRRKKRHIR